MTEKIFNSIVGMEEENALKFAKEYLNDGGDPQKLLDVCREAMDEVGEKFEKGEYFLSELLLSGEIFKGIMDLTLPLLKESEVETIGKIVLGTVQDDIHDIGKNIFKAFAEAAGFEVIDIGVDVPEEKFVEAVKEHNPDIVGMSCLITAGINPMKRTVEALKEAGLTGAKIIIGGGRVDEEIKEFSGADAWADDAARGVRLCKELLGLGVEG
ncbi:MAG: cobalamin-binding protein [Tissierellia bacterium]|nr:cobalamin-binding protein [Tissierellia bacterium]